MSDEENKYIKLSEEMVLFLGENGTATFSQFMQLYDHGLSESQVKGMADTMEFGGIIWLNQNGLFELTGPVGSVVYINLLDRRSGK
jgi:hypothetical protein